MLPDLLSASLRGLSFVAMAQAGGAVLFLLLQGAAPGPSRRRIRRLGGFAAAAALVILPVQFALEAARMAGALSGILDLALQRFALSTSLAIALAVRMAGLVLVAFAMRSGGSAIRWAGLPAVVLLAVSFALVGHTSASSWRWLLGPMVALHVLLVCFWFGALRPLVLVVGHEPAGVAAGVIARFSAVGGVLVPLIALAGFIMVAGLVPDLQGLRSTYGMALLAKLAAFVVLMLLAALNRWRFAPALARGDLHGRRRFVTTVACEGSLMMLVLLATAFMTTLASPA
jgi:putative copper resistance protein D